MTGQSMTTPAPGVWLSRGAGRVACVHPVLAAARTVNDLGRRHKRLAVQLAVWSAQQVLGLIRDEHRAVCEQAITAAQAWVRAPSRAAAEAAYTAAHAVASATASATGHAYAAAEAAYTAAIAAYAARAAVSAAAYTAGAITGAAHAAASAAGGADAAITWLTGLIGEYERLTHSEVSA